jgi:hypothetical protein
LDRDIRMNPAKIVAKAQRAGVELVIGKKADRVLCRCRGKLPKEIRAMVKDNREALIRWLNLPATEEDLEAVAKTGRHPSSLLTRGEARELSLLPAPEPATRWGLLLSDYYIGRESDRLKRWEETPATAKQKTYLNSLCGVMPPEGATKGECSFAISLVKRGHKP